MIIPAVGATEQPMNVTNSLFNSALAIQFHHQLKELEPVSKLNT